jgi:peptidoglycan/LPS O-acetylase OafA/YrhL
MFGAFRYFLALLVVEGHLLAVGNLGFLSWAGIYSVFGFYVLSGFLISRVLETHYPATLDGLARFALNRVLRLYPGYLIAFALALWAIAAIPETMAALNKTQVWPADAIDWIRGLSIIGLASAPAIRPVPPAWSVGVEICAYLMMALGLSRSRPVVVAWLAAGIAYHAAAGLAGAEWGARYYPVWAAALPFSLGACLWHFRSQLPRVPSRIGIAAFALFVVHAEAAGIFWGARAGDVGLYGSLAVVTLVVLSLGQASSPRGALRRLDGVLGEFAYPIFLLHWAIGGVMWHLVEGGAPDGRIRVFALTLIPLHLAAGGLVFWIDPVVARARDRVRGAGVESDRFPRTRRGPGETRPHPEDGRLRSLVG